MRKVDFLINRRLYQLMVDADQASQLEQLASEVDGRAQKIAASNPLADELKVLMMTCITLADELYEARQEAGALHERFMLSQPELQSLLPNVTVTNIKYSEAENQISEIVDNLTDVIGRAIRPAYE
jgi:cell division protein ZapA (FtsZ GTPase activity inhibitor)